ncbi:MAG: LacI family DNA-binding transcriptional regulator [Dermatophilaceae bacterium]|nr:LacI family DNA-binding transcriptional regulator [Dermatophilaceae bacterium]NUR17298.1 LacI family DNA-binding transcriptional regulator [Dermatophilaceae bacterium]
MPSPRRPHAVTITDVAREAGVAASTVSRALTNPDRVNVVTREHVQQVAARLGYRASPAARALGTGRTATLALVLPDITNPYFSGLIRGAERQAEATGHILVIGDSEENARAEARMVERLAPGVDGFLLGSSRLPDARILQFDAAMPVVLVNRRVPTVTSVSPDQQGGTRQIVEHLVALGHRRAIFLAGPPESWLGRQRWAGISSAAKKHGLKVRRLGPYHPSVEGGLLAGEAALADGATAVIAHNDLMAIGALKRMKARGVSVPADVSIVGFDDIFGADFCDPPLTTLSDRTEQAGRSAVDLLVALVREQSRLDHDAPADIVAPTQLVVRGSTGPAPTAPPPDPKEGDPS